MPDRSRHGWGRWQAGGQRPPWWPEGEAWPPADGAPWRRMRRRFMWRIGCAMVFMVMLFGTLVALVAWLVSRAFDGTLALVATAVLPLVALFLVVLIVLRLVRRTAAPVSDLIEAAARVEGGDYAARVPERGPREVRSLARAFNAMSERLEGTDDARRRLLADVSHELRTPLTVM